MRPFHASISILLFVVFTSTAALAQSGTKLFTPRQGSDYQDRIEILDVLYGQDQQTCRALNSVGQQCNGRDRCEINADDNLCGNPYANVTKQLFVAYRCGQEPARRTVSVEQGQTALVYCRLADPGRYPTTPAPGSGRGQDLILIQNVVYGIGSRICDATDAFRYQCDDQSECSIKVDNRMCGDPARGDRKSASISYQCNNRTLTMNVREGDTARISCP